MKCDHDACECYRDLRSSLAASQAEVERERDLGREYRDALARVIPERDASQAEAGELREALRAAKAQARPPYGSGLHPVEVVFHMERIIDAALAREPGEGDK